MVHNRKTGASSQMVKVTDSYLITDDTNVSGMSQKAYG